MITTLLIANRGEIACRIINTCQRLGVRTVAVYSEADADSLHVALADEAVLLGPAPPLQSYLNMDALLRAAQRTGADAVHPGYGFLAENAVFARRVLDAGLTFVGPSPEAIELMGSKVLARESCMVAGVPTVPGSGARDDDGLLEWAEEHGYPVMLKASAGGGGKGMRRLETPDALKNALPSARRESETAFGSSELYLEKALVQARHLEVQIACDHHGNGVHLGVRECSLQRRHQKIVEESPPPGLSPDMRAAMTSASLKLAEHVEYRNLGTVEFLVDGDRFYFLEMNTRLQVEHPVTEAVTGQDLVEWQLQIAQGEPLPLKQNEIEFRGHAIEARIYCEDVSQGFLPTAGPVLVWQPRASRTDNALWPHHEVTPYYDPMVAKVVEWGPRRNVALRRLRLSLQKTVLLGVQHNIDYLRELLLHNEVVAGTHHTEFVESLPPYQPVVSNEHLLAAAAARHRTESGQTAWGNTGSGPCTYRFQGHPEVAILDTTYQLDGKTFEVKLTPDSMVVDGHRFPVAVARDGERWWVHTPQGTAWMQATPRHPLPGKRDATGSLKAPMPGSVVEVLVNVGDEVSKNQPLMKLEAMKMEHTICAASDGVVEAIYFRAGDQVVADAQLLKCSPFGSSS